MSRLTIFALFNLISFVALSNQPTITASDYIITWKDEAVYQMALHKIPASITLAQAMLESGNGNSRLAVNGNNHFGIKCHGDWSGKTIHEDDETRNECFRKYSDARESFEDHSIFLQKKRYEPLFSLDVDDYKGWAKGLKECGYATNPKYPQLLIKIIEENKLHEYDELGKEYIEKDEIPNRSGKGRPNIPKGETAKNKGRKNNEDLPSEITLSENRQVQVSENRIKYILAKGGDTPEKIADDLGIHAALIRKYNDLAAKSPLKANQTVYLQPKRNKGLDDTYKVKPGDSMWQISQTTGVKLKKLYSRNLLNPGEEPSAGTLLKLR